MCEYCARPIEYDFWGWGYMLELERVEFHLECLEIAEGVVLA